MESHICDFHDDFQGIELDYVDIRKFHIVLDKYQEIVIFNFQQMKSNIKKEAEMKEYFADSSRKDINMILNIQTLLGKISSKNEMLLDSLEKRPSALANKAKQLENRLFIEHNKFEYDTTDLEIQKLHIERKKIENEMNEKLIQITYDKLSQGKDKFEIECIKTLSSVILNLMNPKSSQIEALLREYSELFKQIVSLNPIDVSPIVAEDINIHLIDIFAKLESEKFKYQKSNYIHLLPFLKWTNAIIQINLLERNKINLPQGNIKKISSKLETLEEIQSGQSIIPFVKNNNEEFMKASLNFIRRQGKLQINVEDIIFNKIEYLNKTAKLFNEINDKNEKLIQDLLNPNYNNKRNGKEFITGVDVTDPRLRSYRFCGFC